MKALTLYWQKQANRIDALSMRERIMVFAAVVVVLVAIINALLIAPLLAHQKQLAEQIVQSQQTTATMQTQIQDLLKTSNIDPNVALQIRLAQLRAQAANSGKTLDDIQSKLVAPQQMPTMLEDILQHNQSVHLVALSTLPVEILSDKTSSDDKTAKPDAVTDNGNHIYKHGVEITVTGNYLDLTRYLSAIEALPWRMFWGKAALSVSEDHVVTLTLRLYTLSQDKTWLSI
ncbi:MAG: type II secretion system protein GspM [Sulfuriferula sp.]|nr:type II secretion system protein GspM [Sulfuriferula sp.]